MRISYQRYGRVKKVIVTIILSLTISIGICQTMFTAFQSSQRKADQAYSDKNYREAAARYESIFSKHPVEEVNLRIARSYYFMREYASAVTWYEKSISKYGALQTTDQYYLAESYTSLGNYEQAVQQYNAILARSSDDILVAKKIWRLKNIQYLYEDSLHYVVQEI
ncbi:MAG TPA: tetratricopeptide repeat protein, partial [Ohtaekwangia sp.]